MNGGSPVRARLAAGGKRTRTLGPTSTSSSAVGSFLSAACEGSAPGSAHADAGESPSASHLVHLRTLRMVYRFSEVWPSQSRLDPGGAEPWKRAPPRAGG